MATYAKDMNEAIKLALQQGYRKGPYSWPVQHSWGIVLKGDDDDRELLTNSEILLDHAFWQALGKALGWEVKVCDLCGSGKYLRGFACFGGNPEQGAGRVFHAGSESAYQPNRQPPEWLYHWHRFIDWIAEGKDADGFFEELLADHFTPPTSLNHEDGTDQDREAA